MTEIEYFWSRVNKTGDCWLWTKALGLNGYGYVWFEKKVRTTHL